jgi:hypothetical protein
MRLASGLLGAAALLSSCGGTPKSTLVFHVDPPPEGDVGCIGVAGFDVTVKTTGRNAGSGPVPNASPVLDPASCHLTQPFTIEDVDLESPASVVVTGHDGAGVTRVQASGRVDNLHAQPMHLQLTTTATPPTPVLVVNRKQLLGAQPLSDLTQMTVSTAKGPRLNLVTVTPGDYFLVEPAAYGVPSNLAPGGADTGVEISADLTTTTQGLLPRVKLTAVWNPNGYYDAKP